MRLMLPGKAKMISQLNKKQQRHLAVGLFCLSVILLLSVIVLPLVSVANSYDESIDDLQFRYQRYRQIVAGESEILAKVKIIKQRQREANHFSNRETSALASADLQQFVKKAIVESGGRLTSTQVIPERIEDNFIHIAIKVRMSGDALILRDVLYAIETAKPMLMIDNLMIRSVRGRRDRRTRKVMPSNELSVNFDVSGYMRAVRG